MTAEYYRPLGQETPWSLVLLYGLANIIIGLLLVTAPGITTAIIVQLLGLYWLIMGIFSIVSIFVDFSNWVLKLLAGFIGIAGGLVVTNHPLWSSIIVPSAAAIILGFAGVIIGIILLFRAFTGEGWGIGILGALNIILGIVLITNPLIAGLTLPVILGAFALVGGISIIVTSFQLRKTQI